MYMMLYCYWSIVDKVTDNCQWLEYLFIDILNTDEVVVLYALSLFTFSSQPNVVEAPKLTYE
jgi:hypothetical protein